MLCNAISCRRKGYISSRSALSGWYQTDRRPTHPKKKKTQHTISKQHARHHVKAAIKHGFTSGPFLFLFFWMSQQLLALSFNLCMHILSKHKCPSTCVSPSMPGDYVPSGPLPTQQAGNWGPMPGPAYRDLATTLHSPLLVKHTHTLTGPLLDLLLASGRRFAALVWWGCFNVG